MEKVKVAVGGVEGGGYLSEKVEVSILLPAALHPTAHWLFLQYFKLISYE